MAAGRPGFADCSLNSTAATFADFKYLVFTAIPLPPQGGFFFAELLYNVD